MTESTMTETSANTETEPETTEHSKTVTVSLKDILEELWVKIDEKLCEDIVEPHKIVEVTYDESTSRFVGNDLVIDITFKTGE